MDYLRYVRSIVPSEPVIHIDDSDVIKPEGYHFEAPGIVRDGSRSTPEKSVFCKGYHVTEACVLTASNLQDDKGNQIIDICQHVS